MIKSLQLKLTASSQSRLLLRTLSSSSRFVLNAFIRFAFGRFQHPQPLNATISLHVLSSVWAPQSSAVVITRLLLLNAQLLSSRELFSFQRESSSTSLHFALMCQAILVFCSSTSSSKLYPFLTYSRFQPFYVFNTVLLFARWTPHRRIQLRSNISKDAFFITSVRFQDFLDLFYFKHFLL